VTHNDSKRRLRARIAALDGVDAELVDCVVRRQDPPEQVAEQTGLSEDDVIAEPSRPCAVQRAAASRASPTRSLAA
jgi:hypothetical protein